LAAAWDKAGQDEPVGGPVPRPDDLAAQDRQLVPQNRDLDVVGLG